MSQINGSSQLRIAVHEDDNLKAQFDASVSLIRSLPKSGPFQPSVEMQLRFYSLFKQATEGRCQGPKPSIWNVVARKKWEAWSALEDTSPREAMQIYTKELRTLLESAPPSEERDRLLSLLHIRPNSTVQQSQILATVQQQDVELDYSNSKPEMDGKLGEKETSLAGSNPGRKLKLLSNGCSESETEFEDASSAFIETHERSEVKNVSTAATKNAGDTNQSTASGMSPRSRVLVRDSSTKGTKLEAARSRNAQPSGSVLDESQPTRRHLSTARSTDDVMHDLLRNLTHIQRSIVHLTARFSIIEAQLALHPRQRSYGNDHLSEHRNGRDHLPDTCCSACGARLPNSSTSQSSIEPAKSTGVKWRSFLISALWPIIVQLIAWYLIRRWRRLRAFLN